MNIPELLPDGRLNLASRPVLLKPIIGTAGEPNPDGSVPVVLNEFGRMWYGDNVEFVILPEPVESLEPIELTVKGTDYRDEFQRAMDAHFADWTRRMAVELERRFLAPSDSADTPHVVDVTGTPTSS